MVSRQCGTMKRARFQTGGLVKIQQMAANLTRNTISSLKEAGTACCYKEHFPFNRQLLNCIYSFVEICEWGTAYDELTDSRTQANFMDNNSSQHAEMYAPGKRQNAMIPLERKIWQHSRWKINNNDTKPVQCITVMIISTEWYWRQMQKKRSVE